MHIVVNTLSSDDIHLTFNDTVCVSVDSIFEALTSHPGICRKHIELYINDDKPIRYFQTRHLLQTITSHDVLTIIKHLYVPFVDSDELKQAVRDYVLLKY